MPLVMSLSHAKLLVALLCKYTNDPIPKGNESQPSAPRVTPDQILLIHRAKQLRTTTLGLTDHQN